MLVLAWLLAASATVTVGPGAPTDCPSSEQVTRALANVAPGIVAPAASTSTTAGGPANLRLSVTTAPEGDVRVDLVDPQNETVLHRELPAPARGRAPDCGALADTIALIVDRYLRDVGYEAPPLAPPPPKPEPPPPPVAAPAPAEVATIVTPPPPPPQARAIVRVGLAASGRLGDAGGADGDGALTFGLESTRLGLRLSAGMAPAAEARWTTTGASQTATLRRLPFRMGGYARIPTGPGHLEPGLGLGADLLLVSGGTSGRHAAPFGDAALGYAIRLIGPVYGRALGRIALSVPYDFNTLSGARVWGTPRVFGEAGVELGLFFQ